MWPFADFSKWRLSAILDFKKFEILPLFDICRYLVNAYSCPLWGFLQ